MITEIAEPIVMAAVFRRGRIVPKQFLWRGRRYRVSDVLGQYHYHKGVYRQNCYTLKCGAPDVYEITFDTEDMSWRLDRLHVEG